jgi:K+-sensing histidine kinase KdpD
VLATAVTFGIRLLVWPALADVVPHMAFFPAVMIAAYYGGFRPGLLGTVLGAVAANVVFTEPYFALGIKSLNAAAALPLFVLVGLIISGLSEALHRARRRLVAEERQRAEEALSQERYLFRTRKRAEEALRQANARLELALRGSNVGVWDRWRPAQPSRATGLACRANEGRGPVSVLGS